MSPSARPTITHVDGAAGDPGPGTTTAVHALPH
jgi:hypothetical protein